MSYEDLERQLKYVPRQAISRSITKSEEFVKVTNGVFVPLSKIVFSSRTGAEYQVQIEEKLREMDFLKAN